MHVPCLLLLLPWFSSYTSSSIFSKFGSSTSSKGTFFVLPLCAAQASELINAAALGQLAAAEASEVALLAQLSQQLAAFEAAQADKAALAQRMTALQVGGEELVVHIQGSGAAAIHV
jgi:ABC-type Fe2+-enterobactin transport system substrate-binding protein